MELKKPERIFVNEKVADHFRVRELIERLPSVPVVTVKGNRHPGGGWFLTKNRGRFIRNCPGQTGYVCCSLKVVMWSVGCPFTCEYCALQSYIEPGDLVLYVNIEEIEREVEEIFSGVKGPLRFTLGEYGDSLALESLFPAAKIISDLLTVREGVVVELKTKAKLEESIEEIERRDRVVISYSLNPSAVAERYEHLASTLEERLDSMEEALSLGFRIAFHFDPILRVDGWRDLYGNLVETLGPLIPAERVAWISMGTFRYPEAMEEIVLRNFPSCDLFREETVPCPDGKRRLPRPLREETYSYLLSRLKEFFPPERVYICMESRDVWDRVFGSSLSGAGLKRRLDARV